MSNKMREILFRGQTRRYGEKVRMGDGAKMPSHWVYGGVLQGAGSHSVIYGGENVDDIGDGLNKHVVYTDTLGQFTGLTDKNGKKIFEDDIIEYHAQCDIIVNRGVVVWDGRDARWAYQLRTMQPGFYMHNPEAVEVIGNIHDNPELLKEATNV